MKSIPLELPWEGCKGYKVFHRKENRMMMNIIRKDGSRTSTSYARYLMSVKMGRFLKSDEHVDHKDENKLNDDIDNLQLISQRNNSIKHVILKNKSSVDIKLECPICNKIFFREPRQVNTKIKNGKKPTCSRSCGGVLSRR